MNVLNYNDPPKLECISAPVIVYTGIFATYLFVSSQASSSKWGHSFCFIHAT